MSPASQTPSRGEPEDDDLESVQARLEEHRRDAALAHQLRTVAVHLYAHEDTAERTEENVATALRTHLGWSRETAHRVMAAGISEDLFVRQGDMLTLTPKGRATARSILEPWRTEGLGTP